MALQLAVAKLRSSRGGRGRAGAGVARDLTSETSEVGAYKCTKCWAIT